MINPGNVKKINPALVLRVGIGGTLVYAGTSILVNTQNWIGFVPRWLTDFSGISVETLLIIHGVFELILGLFLIFGFFLKISSLLSFFDFFSIIVLAGIDLVTFRDFGLLMAALALFILCFNPQLEEQS